MYSVSIVAIYLPSMLLTFLPFQDLPSFVYTFLLLFNVIFLPLQGLFNVLIYTSPTWRPIVGQKLSSLMQYWCCSCKCQCHPNTATTECTEDLASSKSDRGKVGSGVPAEDATCNDHDTSVANTLAEISTSALFQGVSREFTVSNSERQAGASNLYSASPQERQRHVQVLDTLDDDIPAFSSSESQCSCDSHGIGELGDTTAEEKKDDNNDSHI